MSTSAHRDLRRVVASLAGRLAGQLDGMLDDTRFDAGRAALVRLADPAHAGELDALDPREAAWLAEELTRRWAAVAEVSLDPIAWVDGPDRIEAGPHVRLRVHADGLEPGWTVAWNGAVPDEEDPAVAQWSASAARAAPAALAASAGVPASPAVTARVMGRGPDGRVILTASWSPPPPPQA